MAGPESRRGMQPEVLVDGRVAGPVDTQLRIVPGSHRICVRRGWFRTREDSYTFHPGRIVVLDYEWHGTLDYFFFGFVALNVYLVRSLYRLADAVTPPVLFLLAAVVLAVDIAVVVIFHLWVIPRYSLILKAYSPAADPADNPAFQMKEQLSRAATTVAAVGDWLSI